MSKKEFLAELQNRLSGLPRDDDSERLIAQEETAMRTLSIGNSFSEDACAYLHLGAESAGIEWETVNLVIGGCSLAYHAENLREGCANYMLEINGQHTGRMISLPEALSAGTYDVITLQQASRFSGKRETYYPFIGELAEACRAAQPSAKLMLQQTWAYETDWNYEWFADYGWDQKRMYSLLCDAYREAADSIGAGLIPVGDVVQYFREQVPGFDYPSGMSLCRDGFHLSIPVGRYLAALVWFETLSGQDCRAVSFRPDGMEEERQRALVEAVHAFLAGGRPGRGD